MVLGEDAGYRVFYKDVSNRLRCLGYVPNGPWGDWGAVSNDEIDAMAIGAAFTGSDNITVVTPKGAGNMEVAQVHDDSLWHIRKFSPRLFFPGLCAPPPGPPPPFRPPTDPLCSYQKHCRGP